VSEFCRRPKVRVAYCQRWHDSGSKSFRPDDKVLLENEKYCLGMGHSTMEKNAGEKARLRPYKLKAFDPEHDGEAPGIFPFRKKIIKAVRRMWKAFKDKSPDEAARILELVDPEFRIGGTGFTKITMALNNPTPVHHDRGNVGITAVLELCSDDIEWGDHAFMDDDTVYAFKPRSGTLFLGPYKQLRHGNMATAKGGRWICTAYTSKDVVAWCEMQRKKA